jgi:hypothetical protein
MAISRITSNAISGIVSTDKGGTGIDDVGATGNVLTSNGTAWVSKAGGSANIQTFDASDTWNKPASGSMARIQVWGGGGGAGRAASSTVNQSGGGGGGYNEITLPLSSLGSTVTVTIGAGGAGRTGSTGNGTAGGQTLFGSHCTAYGGGGGIGTTSRAYVTGGGGGQLSAGSTTSGGFINESKVFLGRPYNNLGKESHGFGYQGGTGYTETTSDVNYYKEGDALYGGGAGSFGASNTPGLSVYGGNGGAINTAGTAPGGGGGASSSVNGNGSDGAAGRVVVTVW